MELLDNVDLRSSLGLVFPVITYIYLGSIGSDFLNNSAEANPQNNMIKWSGFVVTVIISVIVTKITKRALKEYQT